MQGRGCLLSCLGHLAHKVVKVEGGAVSRCLVGSLVVKVMDRIFNLPQVQKLWIDDLICHKFRYGIFIFLSLTHCEVMLGGGLIND